MAEKTSGADVTCEWCGHQHDAKALCSKRPKWSRRGFLALFGAGVAGLALPVEAEAEQLWQTWTIGKSFETLPAEWKDAQALLFQIRVTTQEIADLATRVNSDGLVKLATSWQQVDAHGRPSTITIAEK